MNGLRVFESVASHLSFTEAAEALHVTPAAMSMQIRALEQYLVAWQERGTAYDDSLIVLAGAEQGQGLALTRWSLPVQDLTTGRIMQASERIVPCPRAYYFVCPEMYVTMPKVQQLLAWLREMAAAFPRPDSTDVAAAQPPLIARKS